MPPQNLNGLMTNSSSTPLRKKWNPALYLHGWINLDKPLNITSTQAVSRVRSITGTKKAGHAGTLDPLASGILPIALGEATKTIGFMQDSAKEYCFTVAFGEARDTDDLEGTVIETSPVRPSQEAILKALPSFTGHITQCPPIYSAIKVAGERSYDLAREGKAEPLPPRPVYIASLTLTDYAEDGSRATFLMRCGKGTYVRSLGRDLAKQLGSCGHIVFLRRTQVGNFSAGTAISLDKLEEIVHTAPQHEFLLSVDTVLDDIPAIIMLPQYSEKLRNGQAIPIEVSLPDGQSASVVIGGKLAAIGIIDGSLFKPNRVFNY
jgi:tRNA pseudouridine55 synthase